MAEIDIGQITEALNDKTDRDMRNVDTTAKADAVIDYQEPTTDNGYTWYRKYASGWVEQGGCYTASNTTQPTNYKNTITFVIPFADTNYTVSAIGWSSDDSSYSQDGVFESSSSPRTTTTFTVDHEAAVTKFNLMACGKSAN